MKAPTPKRPTPTKVGVHNTEAFVFDMAALSQRHGNQPHASLKSWAVYAPWAHPAWHTYMIALLHLRPLPGFAPPKMNLPGATHEIIVFAVDPVWNYDLKEGCGKHLLHPVNFVAQFVEASDAAAEARVESTVDEILAGQLSPDTDYLQHWIHRYVASNIKGDPKRAGETRITRQEPGGKSEELVIDPAGLAKKPDIKVCATCGEPFAAPIHDTTTCLHCSMPQVTN